MMLELLPAGVLAQGDSQQVAVETAVDWLLDQQADDGGFPGFAGESDAATTADAVIALTAAKSLGIDAGLESALAYLEANALVFAQTSPGSAAKLSLTLSAAGLDPHDIGGVDPLTIVQTMAVDGPIGFGPFDHALGLLALAAAGEEIPDAAIAAARDSQAEDGGWSFDGTTDAGAADTNTTSLMVQALVALGPEDDEAVARGLDYLLSTQEPDGGFPYQPGGPADANSTALALQALIASGADELAIDSAMAALLEFQNDNGSFTWLLDPRDDNMFATLQAMPALAGLVMPIVSFDAGTPVAATPEPSPVAVLLAA